MLNTDKALISQDANRTKIENQKIKKVTENGHFPFEVERRNKKKGPPRMLLTDNPHKYQISVH